MAIGRLRRHPGHADLPCSRCVAAAVIILAFCNHSGRASTTGFAITACNAFEMSDKPHYTFAGFGEPCFQMIDSKASLPLEHWIGYRFSLISARLGNYVAQMYASRHDLTMPAWRSLAVIARYQPLTAKQLAMLTSSDA